MSKIIVATLFLISLSTPMAWAVDCTIPDTGQTKCYDNSGEIICPSSGQDFYGQDAQYPCNPQSYTKLDEYGNDLPDGATSWVMVRDNVTGLIWENKTDDGSIHDKDDEYDWQGAQDVFIATLNNDNFGGYSDWRLPTVNELYFIINLDTFDPAINTDYFPNTVSSYYWSSTSTAYNPTHAAWHVDFRTGGMFGYNLSYNDYVRAVRGGQCGSYGDFVDNGDATVTDTSTGLMWEVKADDDGPRDKDNLYTWQQALSYCEDLTLAGYDDWRLPNINELQWLVDYTTFFPSINIDYFPNTVSSESSDYWSSTSYPFYPSHSWGVNFYGGYITYYVRSAGNLYVRAVRGGQCGSVDPSTTTTTASACSSELIYGVYSEETELLRHFRDNVLSQTPAGQEIIRLYYEWSPAIVKAMEQDEEFKEEMRETVDGFLGLIEGETE